MCGRFTLRAPASVVAGHFGLLEVPPFAPLFNIAPTQAVAVVRIASEDPTSPRELVWMHWGLVPGWAQDRSLGFRMINARAETVSQKPAYRAAFRRRRALVAADGFYEWQHAERTAGLGRGAMAGRGAGAPKQPYFVRLRDESLFAFAGLWETWESPEGEHLDSCAIITTQANELMRPIHDRMPVILAPEDYGRWLDPRAEPADLRLLLRPYPSDAMVAFPVSTYVNSPAHDDPKCIAPLRADRLGF